jgi:hypothetical protein
LAHRAHARRATRGPALDDHHARDGGGGAIHGGQPAGEKLQAALREHQWGARRAPGGVVSGGMHRSRGGPWRRRCPDGTSFPRWPLTSPTSHAGGVGGGGEGKRAGGTTTKCLKSG